MTMELEAAAIYTPMSRDEMRAKILELQAIMTPLEQVDCPLKHHFAPGTYGREILLPKGALVIGKIHRHAHLNIITRGFVTVLTETGMETYDAFEGPVTFCSKVGTKRIVYAHSDTIWTTIHLTDKTDLAEIEEEIIAPSYAALDGADLETLFDDLWAV